MPVDSARRSVQTDLTGINLNRQLSHDATLPAPAALAVR